jgi:hypothetical protein
MSLAPVGLIDYYKALMADNHEKAEIINESEIQDSIRRPMVASSFDGHICSIPSKKRLTLDDRWICIECDQRWRVGSRWDRIKWEWVLHWKMYGRDIFTIA